MGLVEVVITSGDFSVENKRFIGLTKVDKHKSTNVRMKCHYVED